MKPPKFDATYESDAAHRLGQGPQLHRTSKLQAANSIDHRPRFIGARHRSLRFRSGTTYLDKAEMDALLAAPDRRSAQGQRDYALLLFLYNSGARASEAADLTIEDIDRHSRAVRITGKGRKQRICPLWPQTLEQLRGLTMARAPGEAVFLNRRRQPITRFGIHAMVERYAARAATSAPSLQTKSIGPHVVRHTAASHLLRSGVDINTIRAWLGHVSLNTTNIYAEVDLETKARALAACSPEEKPQARWRNQPEVMAFLRSL